VVKLNAGLGDRTFLSLALLVVILIVSNLAFAYSNGWSRLGWQLFGYGGLLLVFKLAGLSLADIGLSKARLGSGLKYGLITVAIILVVLLTTYLVKQNVFHDDRYHQSLRAALSSALLFVPLKTVIFEELAFRGIMPALLKNFGSGQWTIMLVSAILFGLWHITTAPKTGDISIANFSNYLILGTVFLTTCLGGVVFYLLRYHSDSLLASILVHWCINGSSIVLSALSWVTH
jgi:membrane protease YdiL (CAAX protease family)